MAAFWKVRWKRPGTGKSKSELDNLTGPELKEIRRALED